MNSKNAKWLWLAFIVAVFFVYFVALGRAPLLGPDEPRYAEVAREMYERGDLVTPTLGGHTWFEKPALLYWLMMAGYRVFGVSEFAARAGGACAGVLTIFILGWLGSRIENRIAAERSGKDAKRENFQTLKIDFGLLTAAVAASSGGLLAFSRGATFDILLTFTITLTLSCALALELLGDNERENGEKRASSSEAIDLKAKPTLSQVNSPPSQLNAQRTQSKTNTSRVRSLLCAGFYVGVGLSLLAKGLVGIVLPCGVLCVYALLRRSFKGAFAALLINAWRGAPLALAVAATWYAPVIMRHGWLFIDEFFIQHHFARYVSDKYHHSQPVWYYLTVIAGLALPHTLFLIASFADARRWLFTRQNADERLRANATLNKMRQFAFSWLIFPVAFFSFSGSKLPGYVLPALPGAILLASDALRRYLERNNAKRRDEYASDNAGDKMPSYNKNLGSGIVEEELFSESDGRASTRAGFAAMTTTGLASLILGVGGCVYAMRELGLSFPTAFLSIGAPTLALALCASLFYKRRRLCVVMLIVAPMWVVACVAMNGLEQAAEKRSVRALLRKADALGYVNAPVYEMHTIERTAEFYAAGRIAYQANGEPVKLEGPTEAEAFARRSAPQAALVIIPLRYLNQLTNDANLNAKIIGDNGTDALVAIEAKRQ